MKRRGGEEDMADHPRVFIFDPPMTRNYESLLGIEWSVASWDEGFSYHEGDEDRELPAGSLLVAHFTQMGDIDTQRTWLDEHKVYSLIISGDELELRERKFGYARKARVMRAPSDEIFRKCFDRFWKDFVERKSPKWQLIEPDQWPQHLVAAYLLLSALDEGKNGNEKSRRRIRESIQTEGCVWKKIFDGAGAEFGVLVRDGTGWKECGLPRKGERLKLSGLKVQEALRTIREAFPSGQ